MVRLIKASKDTRKNRGAPSNPVLTVRLPVELVNRIDVWVDEHDSTRADAIRTLVEIGLTKKIRERLLAARAVVLQRSPVNR